MENESLHATLKLEKQCVKTFFSCLSSVEVPIPIYQKRLKLNHWLNSLILGNAKPSQHGILWHLRLLVKHLGFRRDAELYRSVEPVAFTQTAKYQRKDPSKHEKRTSILNLVTMYFGEGHEFTKLPHHITRPLWVGEATRSIQFSSYRAH